MDPQARSYLAQSLMQRPRRPNPNPYGSAFSGLAQILAQRNFRKAEGEIARNQALEEEARVNSGSLAMIQMGMEPEMAEYLSQADPSIQKALMDRFMEQQDQEQGMTPEQAASIGIPEEQIPGYLAASNNERLAIWNRANPEIEAENPIKYTRVKRFEIDKETGQKTEHWAWVDPQNPAAEPVKRTDPIPVQVSQQERKAGLEADALENIKPTTTTETKLQSDLKQIDDQLAFLENIDMDAAMGHLTAGGRVSDAIATGLNLVGVEDLTLPFSDQTVGEQVYERQTIENNTGQLFAVFRRLVTGAAASMPELARLEEIFINMKMAPAAFRASYDQLLAKLKEDRKRLARYTQLGMADGRSEDEAIADARALINKDGFYSEDIDKYEANIRRFMLTGDVGEGEDLGLKRP